MNTNLELVFRTDSSDSPYAGAADEKVFMSSEDSSNFGLGDQSTDQEPVPKKCMITNNKQVKSIAQKRQERKQKLAVINQQRILQDENLQKELEEKQKMIEKEKENNKRKRKSAKNDKYIGMTPAEKKLAKKQEQMMKNRISAQVSRDRKKQEREEMQDLLDALKKENQELKIQLENAKGVCKFCGNRFLATSTSTEKTQEQTQQEEENNNSNHNCHLSSDSQSGSTASSSGNHEDDQMEQEQEQQQEELYQLGDLNLFKKESEFLNFGEENHKKTDIFPEFDYNIDCALSQEQNLSEKQENTSHCQDSTSLEDEYIRSSNDEEEAGGRFGFFSPFSRKMLNFTFFAMFAILFFTNSDSTDNEGRQIFDNQHQFFEQIPEIYEDQDNISNQFYAQNRRKQMKELVQTLDEFLEYDNESEDSDQEPSKAVIYKQLIQQKMDQFLASFQEKQQLFQQFQQNNNNNKGEKLGKSASLRQMFQNKFSNKQKNEIEKYEKVKNILDIDTHEIYSSDYDLILKERSESTQESSENYSEQEEDYDNVNVNVNNNNNNQKNINLIMDDREQLKNRIMNEKELMQMISRNFTDKQQIDKFVQQGENLLQEYKDIEGQQYESSRAWFSLNCIISEIKKLSSSNQIKNNPNNNNNQFGQILV